MNSEERLQTAFASPAFPCNPIPFANGISEYVKINGSDSIKSDACKTTLWVLMAQAYGQMAKLDLGNEWNRLEDIRRKG